MSSASLFIEFVRLPTFERRARGLLGEEAIREVEQLLVQNPARGAVIAGTGGLRKLRFANRGKGKSGGVRIIYYRRGMKSRVYLMTVYPKSQKDDLTGAERNEMRRMVVVLNGEV